VDRLKSGAAERLATLTPLLEECHLSVAQCAQPRAGPGHRGQIHQGRQSALDEVRRVSVALCGDGP
jgi:hypothetical protein